MDRTVEITLIGSTQVQDETGVWQTSRTARDVFAQLDSVTRQEFFDAGRNGFNPAYRFTMFVADYEGEDELVYNGKSYAIYRTYFGRNDTIELYVERKGGTNGSKADTT